MEILLPSPTKGIIIIKARLSLIRTAVVQLISDHGQIYQEKEGHLPQIQL